MNINNVPQPQRKDLLEMYQADEYDSVRAELSKFKALGACETCNSNKDISDWLGYIVKHCPDWINGESV